MAELKTRKNDQSVDHYLSFIEDPQRKADCIRIHNLMADITGKKGSMWGDSIVGFGRLDTIFSRIHESGIQ